METKLARIAEIAKERPEERFISLAHMINEEMLLKCHYTLDPHKAPGVDGVTWQEYNENYVNIYELKPDLMSGLW